MSVKLSKVGNTPTIDFTTLQNQKGVISFDGTKFSFTGDLNAAFSTSPVLYTEFRGGTYSFRMGVRDNTFVIDKTITSTGFDGVEDTDWENITSFA